MYQLVSRIITEIGTHAVLCHVGQPVGSKPIIKIVIAESTAEESVESDIVGSYIILR